jgi:hypothetical protein
MYHSLLLPLLLLPCLSWASESSYRREDVEQVGPYVSPMVETREPRPRDDRLIQSGGRVLLHQLPQGDIMARFRRRDANIEYRLEW